MVYERQIALATRLIAAKGQRCTWREPGAPGGTPARPTDGEPTDYTVSIVFLSNAKNEGLAGLLSMFPDLPDVPTGGMRGLMASQPFAPSLSARIARAVPYAEPSLGLQPEKGIDALNLNGELILYFLRFAR